ncbi:MAG: hypothetical protein RL138_640 [Bacteroidota bacterium]
MINLQIKTTALSIIHKHILFTFLLSLVFCIDSTVVQSKPSGGGHPHTFSYNSASICLGDTLKVQDTCIHDPFQPTSRMWTFSPGAQTSTILNQTQASVVFSTPGIKIITLSVYDIFNVAYTDTLQIEVRGSIADAGASKKYCTNTSGVLIGTSDTTSASISWTDASGAYVGNSRIITVAPAQSAYFYISVNKGACLTRDSVLVKTVAPPIVNAGNNATVCNGNAVTLGTVSQTNLNYLWFPGNGLNDSSIAQPIANPIANTIYTLFVTDTNNCTGNAQVTVNVVNNLIANPGSNVSICFGDSIIIGSAQKSGWKYHWSPSTHLNNANLAQPLAFPTNTTSYKLKVSAYGCSDSNTMQVTVRPLPVVDLQGKHLYNACFHDSISVGGSSISGYHYSWAPNITISNLYTSSTYVYPSSDTWYTLEVLGTNGCKNKDSLLVDVFDSIKAYAGLNQSICLGNSIILGAQLQVASGGTGNYIYQWQPSQTLNNPSFAHPVAQPSNTTQYHLTVLDAGNAKCGSATDSIKVTIFPLPNFQLPFKKMFCKGEAPIILNAIPVGGQFSLIINGNLIPLNNNLFDPNDTAIQVGKPYLIRYQYTSPQGCSYDTAVAVIVKNKPIANAGQDIFYCPARGYYAHQLLGFGTGNPTWFPSSALNNDSILNPSITQLSTQNFVLQIDNGACTATDSVSFIVCTDSVFLQANYNHLFTTANTSKTIQIELNDTSSINKYDHSSFSLQMPCKNGIGYIASTINKIEFSYSPKLDFVGYDTAIYILRDTLDLRVYKDTALILIRVALDAINDTFNTHSGNLGCTDSILHVTLNDHYSTNSFPTITLLDQSNYGHFEVNGLDILFSADSKTFKDSIQYVLTQNGISDTASIYIDYYCPSCHCEIPEGFSPNNDGKNDYLELINPGNCIPDCALIIYNRWGNVVYRTEHYDTKWDGRYNGADLPDGTYFYIINSAENTEGGQTKGYLILQR